MTLIFVSTGNYPDQHAAAIRHSTIAQGMVENGHKVYFFVLTPQGWKANEIVYKGVIFRTLDNHHETNKLLKLYNFYNALNKLETKITAINNQEGVDGVVVFSVNNRIINKVLKIGNKENIKVFHERTELPYVFGAHRSPTAYVQYKYYMNFLIPKFDGLFVISNKLKEFFKTYNSKIEKIPTVVDSDFFNSSTTSPYDFSYIGYCGTMSGDKDGIPILIKAFARLIDDYPEYKLVLVGNNSPSKINATLKLIEKLNINDHIIFTGFIEREEMPGLLGNAKLLVVSKPDNEQNSGNFPIKIGEYLSTGVPVVVTRVGEIPQFIKDKETGFLAEPNSVDSFYEKMKEALSDYPKAQEIGAAGRKVAIQSFDYKTQAERMLKFILQTRK